MNHSVFAPDLYMYPRLQKVSSVRMHRMPGSQLPQKKVAPPIIHIHVRMSNHSQENKMRKP